MERAVRLELTYTGFAIRRLAAWRRAQIGTEGEIRTHTVLFTGQPLCQLELHRQTWPGREADHASWNSTLPDSHRSAGMSHAPITC